MHDAKHISKIDALSSIGSEPEPERINSLSCSIVDKIFAMFFALCRGFDKLYAEKSRLQAEKQIWFIYFTQHGITTLKQVEFGINKLQASTYNLPPSLGQFISWCTPTNEELGLPDTDQAYKEACLNSHFGVKEKNWTHKLVRHAWKLTGAYFLSTSARSVSFPVFERNYEIAIREWRQGKQIDEIEIPLAITEKKEKKRSEEVRKKAMAEIMAKLK